MNRRLVSTIVAAVSICLWFGQAANAEEPLIPIYVGCGFAINWTQCEGCENAADDCHCDEVLTDCKTNHRVCYAGYRAFDDCDYPPCVYVFKAKARCWKRYQCNDDSGEDGGDCSVSSHCTTSEEWVEEGWGYRYWNAFQNCVQR